MSPHSGPTEVIRDPGGFDAIDQAAEIQQVVFVEGIARTDRETHPVEDHGVVPANTIEDVEWPPALDHEILGNHLEPVDRGWLCEHAIKVLVSQSHAVAKIGHTRH